MAIGFDGFKETQIEAENNDRKQVFINYYNKNKEEVRSKLQENIKLNVTTVRDLIIRLNKEIFLPEDLYNRIMEMTRRSANSFYELSSI